MKKKTLRKLTLSAVTLGVAALSLTSTTYAWFTTNGSAEAKGVNGTVNAAGITMLIKNPSSWTNSTPTYTNSFSTSINLVKEGNTADSTLNPVAIGGAKADLSDVKFTKKDDNGHTFNTTATGDDYLHYQVVISINGLENDHTYDVKMQLPQLKTSVTATQYLLVDAGTGAKAGMTIQVSIEDALSLGIKNTIVTSGEGGNYATYGCTAGGSITSFEKNDASGYYHAVAETNELVDASNTSGDKLTGDAVTYYNNVYGLTAEETGNKKAIALPTDYSNFYQNTYFNTKDSKWSSTTNAKTLYTIKGTESGESFVCVTDLYFFIDGWDNQCFNAIGGLDLFDTTNNIIFSCTDTTNNS